MRLPRELQVTVKQRNMIFNVCSRKKERKDSGVATSVNYGVASFLS